MAIVVSKNHKGGQPFEAKRFDEDRLEAFMEKYIVANPKSIPLEEVTGVKWCIVARQLAVSHGSIDLLGLARDGNVYAIETKRKVNQDSREVIAQLLDYASALWGDYGADTAAFWSHIERNARDKGIDLASNLRELLEAEECQCATDQPEQSGGFQERLEGFKQDVNKRLRDGDFRLIAVTDKLKPNVKAMIRYLNEHGDFGVLGVELEYYDLEEEDLQIVVPTVYGDEAWGKRAQTGGAGVEWDEESFFCDLTKQATTEVVQIAKDLLAWFAQEVTEIAWNRKATYGSFSPRMVHEGHNHVIIVVSSANGGVFNVNFRGMYTPPFKDHQLRNDLRMQLNMIEGVQIGEARLNGYPEVSLSTLATAEAMEAFKGAVRWWKQQVLAYKGSDT